MIYIYIYIYISFLLFRAGFIRYSAIKKVYFDFAFVLNSLFIRRHKFHLIASNALIAEYIYSSGPNTRCGIPYLTGVKLL